jgi:hypothetical protein
MSGPGRFDQPPGRLGQLERSFHILLRVAPPHPTIMGVNADTSCVRMLTSVNIWATCGFGFLAVGQIYLVTW